MNSTDHTLRIRITGDTAEIVGASKKASSAIDGVGQQSKQTTAQLNRLNTATNDVTGSNRLLSGSYSLLKGAIAGIGVSYAATKLVDTIGETQTLNIRIKELSGSTQEYQKNQEFLRESAKNLRKDFFVLGDGYSKILALQKGGLTTQKESQQLLVGLADASSALGANNTQLGQSLFGMSQGLSSGKLKMEELNQVTEPMPGLLQAMDRSLGLASGGFRQMVNDGQVTSEFFKETLIKAFEEFEGASERAGETIPGAMTDIGNAYTEVAGLLEQPVSSALVPVLESVASGLRALPEYADEAKNLLIILSSYAAARFIPPLFVSMKNTALAVATAFNTTSVATNNMGQKIKQATVLQRGLNFAMAGLPGLAVGAAVAIGSFIFASDDGADSAEDFSNNVDALLGNFKKLKEQQLNESLEEGKKGLDESSESVRQLTEQLKNYKRIDDAIRSENGGAFNAASLEVERLKKQLSESLDNYAQYKKSVVDLEAALNKLNSSSKSSTEETKKQAKETLATKSAIENYAASLAKQVQLFGKSKQESRLFNVEQKILIERSKLGKAATEAQVISFEKFADKARNSARALNELTTAQETFENFGKQNQQSAQVIDLASVRAQQLADEAAHYAASADLRENAHQARLAQINGNISDENLIQLQSFDLQIQQENAQYEKSRSLAQAKYEEQKQALIERRTLALEDELLSKQDKQVLLDEIDLQQAELEDARRLEKESKIAIHEAKITSIKQKEAEIQAKLNKAYHDSAVAGTSRMFGDIASTFNTESKKGFEKAKKWRTAQAVIDTYASAVSSYNALSGIPIVGPALGAVAAAAAVAAGLANVKRIRSQSFSGAGAAGGSGYSSSTGGGASAPQATNVVPFAPAPQSQSQNQNSSSQSTQDSQTDSGAGMVINIYETKAAELDEDVLIKQIERRSIDPDSRFAQSIKNEVVNG